MTCELVGDVSSHVYVKSIDFTIISMLSLWPNLTLTKFILRSFDLEYIVAPVLLKYDEEEKEGTRY